MNLRNIAMAGGVFTAICVCVSCGNTSWDEASIAASKKYGDAIVSALGEYYKVNDVYPGELAELVPTYILHIEDPIVGTKGWMYRTDDTRRRFELKFSMNADEYPCYYYDSTRNVWVGDM